MDGDDWKGRIKKWEKGIKPDTATKEDIQEYINTMIYQYTLDRITDDNLWYGFRFDFKDFTLTHLSAIFWKDLQRLRSYLRCGGVYVQQNRAGITIAQTLHNVLLKEEQHAWTDAEIKESETDLAKGPITSVWISLEGNRRLLTRTPRPYGQYTQNGQNGGSGGTPVPIPLPPPVQTNPQPNTNIAKTVGEITKIYSEEQKYDGIKSLPNTNQSSTMSRRRGYIKAEKWEPYREIIQHLYDRHRTYEKTACSLREIYADFKEHYRQQ
ncbi:hypothetical protein L207DRAFT_43612 [Hyaloscypha variabilis F]|uniref:Uncharacterized protein n=1 Tax=Hyaloscypha variabilis (strain UAMH 11265 / GT02V1 / F) TaxID=1149755 RepID=A0A2J6RJQ6_HYAVF|nr:hypothetical protein L207DRAFT_43612 [Hyaloscypha variabilis F]